jgi:hypothetical protein
MKKAIVIVLALALFFGLSNLTLGSADNSIVCKEKSPQLEMSPEQKSKVIQLKTELLEVKKEIIKENLKNNKITQDQADTLEKKLNNRLEQLKSGELGHGHRHR